MDIRVSMAGALSAALRNAGETRPERCTHPGWRRKHQAAVAMLTGLLAVFYSGFALIRYLTFHTGSYDLVIFDQAVRSYAHFQPGISIIKGTHNGFGPHFSVLGDHFSPILATLAPLYWIYDSPETLLVAQGVLFALAIPPLWMFTQRAFGGGTKATVAAYLIAVVYGLSWPIAAAVDYNFHEVAFAPVLMVVALERLQAGRLGTALIALAALLLVKEDVGLVVAGFGFYLAVARPRLVNRQRLVAVLLIVAGIAAAVLATYVLIPVFGGRSNYYWAYTALGNNAGQAAWHLITHPASSLGLLITPRVKLVTMLWLFGAFCFLPLLSPITLIMVPLLLERMLGSVFSSWWGTSFQYNAFLVIILICAAVDGAARLDRWVTLARQRSAARRMRPAGATATASAANAGLAAAAQTAAPPSTALAQPRAFVGRGTVAVACAAAMCALALCLVPRFAFGDSLHRSFYQRDARMKAAAAAVAAVPSGVIVEAANHLGPQLSARDTVLLWDGDGHSPRWPPWVVADVAKREFTFASIGEQRRRVALLERNGYRVVFQRLGYLVLHRGSTQASGDTSRRAAA